MTTMTALPTPPAPPARHTWTAADLAHTPDDGNRYELIDGTLLVTPSPIRRHQRASGRLHIALAAACPPDLEVIAAPFDVHLTDDTVVEPDLLVTTVADDRYLQGAPLLAVEVLSPATRRVDLTLKKACYEAAGCPSYWVVDPGDAGQDASVTAWNLRDGVYVEAGHAVGDETLHLEHPFPVDVVPAELVGPKIG